MKKLTILLLGFLLLGNMAYSPIVAQKRDVPLSEQVKIFPNPSNGEFQLSFTHEGREKVTAKVYDITGKLVEDISEKLVKEDASISARVDLNVTNTGIYFLRIQIGLNLITKKIVIK